MNIRFEGIFNIVVKPIIVDFLPVSSNIKGGVEAATGFNPITQKEVDSITRGVGALGLFGGFLIKGGSKLVRKGDDLWGVLNKETKKVEGRGIVNSNLGKLTKNKNGTWTSSGGLVPIKSLEIELNMF